MIDAFLTVTHDELDRILSALAVIRSIDVENDHPEEVELTDKLTAKLAEQANSQIVED